MPLGPFGPLGLLGRLGFPLPESRRSFRRPKPILPMVERVGVKHDSFCCNVLPGGCLLWSRRSLANGDLWGRRLGSLWSRGSLAGLGLTQGCRIRSAPFVIPHRLIVGIVMGLLVVVAALGRL